MNRPELDRHFECNGILFKESGLDQFPKKIKAEVAGEYCLSISLPRVQGFVFAFILQKWFKF